MQRQKWLARLYGVATINALGEAWGGKKGRASHAERGTREARVPSMEDLRMFGIGLGPGMLEALSGDHAD